MSKRSDLMQSPPPEQLRRCSMLDNKGVQCRKAWTIVVTYESGVTRYLCATHSAKLQEQRNKAPDLYEKATFRGALQ